MICMVHGGTITFRSTLLECFMEPAKGVFDLWENVVCVEIQIPVQSSPVNSTSWLYQLNG